MTEPTHNPFASPSVAATQAIPDSNPEAPLPEFNVSKSLGKWTLVCILSAAPSFFWASALGANAYIRSAAMLAGIATFIGFFVYLESREWTQRKLLDRSLRSAVKTGFVTRVIISVVFPLAIVIDLWCGLISISLVGTLFGSEPPMRDGVFLHPTLVFGWFYITTIVQGIILNLVLGTFTLLVYAGIVMYKGMRKDGSATA